MFPSALWNPRPLRVAPAELAERLRAQVVPWSVNALAQLGGLAALADEDYAERTRAWLASEASTFGARLAAASDRLMDYVESFTRATVGVP